MNSFPVTAAPFVERLFFPNYLVLAHLLKIKKFKVKSLSRIRLFATPWTVARQAPLSMEFSKLEYWSGLQLPSPRDRPDAGIEPRSYGLQADSLLFEPPGKS